LSPARIIYAGRESSISKTRVIRPKAVAVQPLYFAIKGCREVAAP